MSEDDLSDDLQNIMDDLDDDLFGQRKKPDLDDPLERRRDLAPKPASSPPKGNGKKVKFEENEKDEGAGKTFSKKLDLDDKSSIMDDLFGSSSAKKENKSSFLDDILGEKSAPKKEPLVDKKDFVLDDKYKKSEKEFSFGDLGPPRRRRGQPTMGNTKPEIKTDIFTETSKTDPVPNDKPVNITTTSNTNTTSTYHLPQSQPPQGPAAPSLHSVVESQSQELGQHLQSLYNNQNKVNQAHAEQSQKLLERVQQQFEEEVLTRQKMFMSQLEMMTKIQREGRPHPNILDFFSNQTGDRKEITDEKMKLLMEEKIADIECVFKVKEEKLKENYEIIIKDLENKLDIEQGRFRDAAEVHREEKDKLRERHDIDMETFKEKNAKLQDSMREEYLGVIENLKKLRRIENDCKVDMNETSQKICKVSESLESQTKEIQSVGDALNQELGNNIRKKGEDLERKEKELLRLQQTLISRQEVSDSERRKLTESILSLEGKLHKKELELESEKRQTQYEREQMEFRKKQFECEREGFLENLKKEKEKMYLDRENYNRDLDNMKKELDFQLKSLRKEKAKYNIKQRLGTSKVTENFEEGSGQKIEEVLEVLEEEKIQLKKEKERCKQETKKIAETRKKLASQRAELAAAIEKLYDVERGLDEKFDQLDKLQEATTNIKLESVAMVEGSAQVGAESVLGDIKDSILELLRQEQRVKGESLALERERRQLQTTRQSLLCSGCSSHLNPLRKSVSVKELRAVGQAGDWDQMMAVR